MDWKRQPAVRLALWITAGIVAGYFLSPSFTLLLALTGGCAVLGYLLVVVVRRRYGTDLQPFYVILLALCIGTAKYSLDSTVIPQNHISRFLSHGKQAILTGTIAEQPVQHGERVSFILQSISLLDDSLWYEVSGDVLVSFWYRQNDSVRNRGLEYGDTVRVSGEIDRPMRERNPGEFNYRNYLELNNIYAVMRVAGVEDIHCIQKGRGNFFTSGIILPIRRYINNVVESMIGGVEGAFLKGLLIGDRSGIPSEVQMSFVNAGVVHILAVSGLNVAFVALIVVALGSFLPGNRILKTIVIIFILLLYMAVAGSTPSIVRATLMVVVVLIGNVIQRRTDILNALAVSALLIYAYDTRQFFDIGFQLSYAAVISLVLFYSPMERAVVPLWERYALTRPFSPVVKLFLVSFAAQVGTLPLIVQYFGRVSLISFCANIVVVPAANIALAVGLATVIFSTFSTVLAGIVAAATQLLLYLMLIFITMAAHVSWSVAEIRPTTCWHTFGYFLLLIVLFSMWKGSWKRRGLIGFLAVANLLAFYPDRSLDSFASPSRMTITFLDVGQADATIIEFPNGKVFLVDAGSRTSVSDAGERVIIPYLKRRGIANLDAFLLTHDHSDHTGGARSVVESIPVGKIYLPQSGNPTPFFTDLREIARTRNIPVEFLSAGMSVGDFDGSRLFVLHPDQTGTGAGPHEPSLNNTSVVLRLCYGRSSILLMGDAEAGVEEELCRNYGDFLHSSVIKVAHHGSPNASSDQFISMVRPDYAVVSVGKYNKFKHPSADVLTRYRYNKVLVERTDEQGAVVFSVTPDSLWKVHWH
jgi:competence protein ComEC